MFKFNEDEENLKCSFCGKDQDQVKKLVAGSGVYICNECIELCSEIVEEELAQTTSEEFTELPTPKEIMDHLNEYVIGQEKAKNLQQLQYIITINVSNNQDLMKMKLSYKK